MPALTSNPTKSPTWRSSDNLGTVRDLAEYDSATDTTSIVDHYVYDAFGNETDHTGSNDFLFKYTGRAFDDETGLQNNLNRWFDPTVGRWLSEDPIGFEAGDANVYRYVGNFATGATDPNGLDAAQLQEKLKQLQQELKDAASKFGHDDDLLREMQKEIRDEICDTEKKLRQAKNASAVAKEQKNVRTQAHQDPLEAQRSFDEAKRKGKVPDYYDSTKTDHAARRAAKEAAEKAAREGKESLAKRIGKKIPVIGFFVSAWFLKEDCEAKGIEAGIANSILDSTVGIPKAIYEVTTGDELFPDRQEPAMQRPAKPARPPLPPEEQARQHEAILEKLREIRDKYPDRYPHLKHADLGD